MSVLRIVGGLLLTTALAAACSLSSGYDPSAYPETKLARDPDTEPLPPAPKTRIADPRHPPEAPSQPEPAPAVASAAPESAPSPPSASASASASKPIPPAPAAPVAAACGTKDNPCPMQKLMRGPIAVASTPEALEGAFRRVAALSPNGGWQWTAIAQKGAELAKSGDTAGAKKQCKTCHDQYRDAYKSQYRGRKI